MVDHVLIQLALRQRALSLVVATTGSVSLSATATGYARAAGSFLTDGFAQGMEVTPVGFASNPPSVIARVDALTMTVADARTVEVAAGGRSLSVGFPSQRAWENVSLTPIAGKPYIEEQYVPGPMSLQSEGANGDIVAEPMYHLNLYLPQGTGIGAGGRYTNALLTLFAPGTQLNVATDFLEVRSDPAPFAGQRSIAEDGYSTVPITIPLRLFTQNSI